MDYPHTQALTDEIVRHGGIATSGDLAKRWTVSRQWVTVLAKRPAFPPAVAYVASGQALYSVADADEYFHHGIERRA